MCVSARPAADGCRCAETFEEIASPCGSPRVRLGFRCAAGLALHAASLGGGWRRDRRGDLLPWNRDSACCKNATFHCANAAV